MDKIEEIKELLKKLDQEYDKVCDRLGPGRERGYEMGKLQATFMNDLRAVVNH